MGELVIVITGPTASGKTALSLELAGLIDAEIISADSRQIYKYLNIGTAKPSPDQLNRIKHHFIDYLEPDQEYNAGIFEKEALEKIREVLSRGRVPVVTGGSGLYIKAVVDGIIDIDRDENLRSELHRIRREEGNEKLYDILNAIDPGAAAGLIPQNYKRVIRAIEVKKLTGKSILELHDEQQRNRDYTFLQFAPFTDRKKLYKRIEERVDTMISAGLVEEVENVLKMGYGKDLNSLNTVGYKEIIAYLDGEHSLEKAVELIKRNTRRFAKRQLTWFRRDDRINWLKIDDREDLRKGARVINGKVKN